MPSGRTGGESAASCARGENTVTGVVGEALPDESPGMTGPVRLDIRPVEPKDRFERIMSTYDGLAEGATLDLTVDHDPKCMYYTLKSTRGDDAFTFEYLENGPEIWRVHVHKRTMTVEA